MAEKDDAVAGALSRYARHRKKSVDWVFPREFWRVLAPELRISRKGRIQSSLSGRRILSRCGALRPIAPRDWAPKDRHYAWMEAQAALLAFLAAHPRIINRPKPADISGCGLRLTEQFLAAEAAGLAVPDWTVTTRLRAALRFLKRHEGVAVHRDHSEDIYCFPRAKRERLVDELAGSPRSPVLLLQGQIGYLTVTTFAAGQLWHFDVVRQKRLDLPDAEASLRSLFGRCGLEFAQAVGILPEGPGRWVFHGMTALPQLRHYLPFSDEVNEALLGRLEEMA
ncbi:MAG: hypothetical protein HY552_04065 [Elusimicrobia bacterium]|nr:hypothetical protein [Elusimicrobiota bacterium]